MGEEELRLGNWVSNTHGIPMIVKAIYKDTVYVDFKGNIGGLWEFNRHEPFKPIELTEEILLKCGDINWLLSDGEGYYILINNKKIRIKFVHSLQNMYFYIEQKELILCF